MQFEMEKTPQRQIYNLLIGLVAPRPIAWVTSMDEEGKLNAAPFSAYNYLCTDPPIVGIGVTNRPNAKWVPKDTARNIRRTGRIRGQRGDRGPAGEDEYLRDRLSGGHERIGNGGAHHRAVVVVKVPRIAEVHAALECRSSPPWRLGVAHHPGRVVAMYVEDRFVVPEHDGAGPYIKAEELHAVGR